MSTESTYQSTFHHSVKHAILRHINTGLNSARDAPELTVLANEHLPNEHNLSPSNTRDVIAELRAEGFVIISKRGHGYYRPESREEFNMYVSRQHASIQRQRENLMGLVSAYYNQSEVVYD